MSETITGAIIGVLNSMPVPAMLLSSDLTVVAIAPSLRRLLGIAEDLEGKSFAVIPALQERSLQAQLRDSIDLLEAVEAKVRDRGGRWLQVRARPYRSYLDKIEGLIVTVSDIDDIRRNERSLLQQNETARSILDHLPSSVAVVDADCRIIDVNRAFTQLTRLKHTEILGRSFPDLVRSLWGELDMHERLTMLQESQEDSSFAWEYNSVNSNRLLLPPRLLHKGQWRTAIPHPD